MIVRKATLSDIPAVAALERAEFPDGADEGMLTRLWETDGGVILAAGERDALLGYVWARFVLDEGEIECPKCGTKLQFEFDTDENVDEENKD